MTTTLYNYMIWLHSDIGGAVIIGVTKNDQSTHQSRCLCHRHRRDAPPSCFSQSSFADYALAHEQNVVKARDDVPLEILGPMGCGVMTGAGAVMNALQPRPGASIAVFGVGLAGTLDDSLFLIAACLTINMT